MVKKLKDGFNIMPRATLTFAHNQIDAYNESGVGTLNLAVKNNKADFFEGRIGENIGYNETVANPTPKSHQNLLTFLSYFLVINSRYSYCFLALETMSLSRISRFFNRI